MPTVDMNQYGCVGKANNRDLLLFNIKLLIAFEVFCQSDEHDEHCALVKHNCYVYQKSSGKGKLDSSCTVNH